MGIVLHPPRGQSMVGGHVPTDVDYVQLAAGVQDTV